MEQNKEKLLEWAKSVINDPIFEVVEIAKTKYSYVLQLNTSNETYFLKQTPNEFLCEIHFLHLLKEKEFDGIAEIVSSNDNLRCFITKKIGDMSLQEYSNEEFNPALTFDALLLYKKIQDSFSLDGLDSFLSKEVIDWREGEFLAYYERMLANEERLFTWGITQEDFTALKNRINTVAELKLKLHSYHETATLNHSDLNDSNIRVELGTEEISIIDWGEINLANPLLSLSSFLYGIRRRYNLTRDNSEDYKKLEDHAFKLYGVKDEDIEDAIETSYILGILYYIFTYIDLMKRCSFEFPNQHAKLYKALKEFIERT